MDHEHAVEAGRGQARIVDRTKFERNIVEPFARDTVGEPLDHFGLDILRQHAARLADPWREPHCIIAIAGADVGHGHAGAHVG